jgi:Transmembrane domain of unknown function (DUF3566)
MPPGSSPYTGSPSTRPSTGLNGGSSWSDGGAGYPAGPPAGSSGSVGPSGSSYPSYTGSPAPRVDVAEPAAARPSAPAESADRFTPRVARLTVASIDPFSALKLSFLLSVAAGIALVIASVVLWLVLSGIGVFDQLNNVLGDLGMNTQNKQFDIYDYIGFGRVVSLSIVIGVINTLLLTALATVTAFLYNLSAGLVGGVRVTLSDD